MKGKIAFNLFTEFTVPDPFDIDIRKYIQKSNTESNICITPTINNTRAKKPVTLRRNRTPPLLTLTKVSMNFSDDEDTSSPPSRYGRTRSHNKLIKRKILNEEYSETVSQTKQETDQSKSNFSVQELIDTKEHNPNISIKDIIKKVELLAPDISEHLYKVDNIDEPATTASVQKLIDSVKDLKVNATLQKNAKKTQHSKKANSDDCDKINEVIALFKDFAINNPTNKKTSEESVSFVKTKSLSYKKQNKTNEGNTDNLEQNNLDKSEKTYKSENTKLKITRKRTEHNVLNKQSYNIRTRKSKEKL